MSIWVAVFAAWLVLAVAFGAAVGAVIARGERLDAEMRRHARAMEALRTHREGRSGHGW